MAASATTGLGGPAARTAEGLRLAEIGKGVRWRRWGTYLSERQWGTVREGYSENGDAWNYFTHDQAQSRAYHWKEDGLAGFSDVGPRTKPESMGNVWQFCDRFSCVG